MFEPTCATCTMGSYASLCVRLSVAKIQTRIKLIVGNATFLSVCAGESQLGTPLAVRQYLKSIVDSNLKLVLGHNIIEFWQNKCIK